MDGRAIIVLVIRSGTVLLLKQALNYSAREEVLNPLQQALHNPLQQEILNPRRQTLHGLLQQKTLEISTTP